MLRFLIFLVALAALAVIAVTLVTAGAAALGLVFGVRQLRERIDRVRMRRARSADPEDPLETAWTLTATEADWAVSRVAAARTSCARLLAIADANPLATDAVDWANVIRRRVPDLVAACMDECEQATPGERRSNLEDLVESLEKIGAEAERRRDRFRDTRPSAFNVQRTYVDQRTRPGPLN
ncbi:hypothetical protein FPZ54_13050 [Sphingomonas suaedae]|uniref:Uncharacterized protein n=1 Tax=Sphingomonas suaedae TaxID=2599297 RepID=A0A518RHC8_9SPHN|nr:hypothetical protein [Sphingomonas suaedae]QDX26841.1 hypothetical protein FPZ54_13050 [Sphingomonas suaedae]